jgi:hypothetical protein
LLSIASRFALWHNPTDMFKDLKISPQFIFLGLLLGAAIGLIYGWVIRPVEQTGIAPQSLKQEYRVDYVLMVAETYADDQELEQARVRLASLGPDNPINYVLEAINYGVEQAFAYEDLQILNRLVIDLRNNPPSAEIGSP